MESILLEEPETITFPELFSIENKADNFEEFLKIALPAVFSLRDLFEKERTSVDNEIDQ